MIPPMLNILLFLLQWILTTNSLTQNFSNGIHKLMTKSELDSTFGSHHDQIPEYETAKVVLHHVKKRHLSQFQTDQPNYHLLAVIQTANTTMHLHLTRKNDFVASTFEIELHHQNYTEIITADQIALPECIFRGDVKNGGKAAVSTCNDKGMVGLIILQDIHYILQPIPPRLSNSAIASHVLYKKKDAHHCPHKFDKTMVAPEESQDNDVKMEVFYENDTVRRLPDDEDVNKNGFRAKRASSSDKVIETAVFVDDVMYESIKKEFKKNALEAVRDVVFTMINAVQLLYNQPSLDRKFSFVLVKVAVIVESSKGPNKGKGDIKNYLLNFCKWQSTLNRGSDRDTQHWDSAIMLSGLNLYQGSPSNHRVIGLAWVSGMCRSLYSCSINEGNNFETVFVITHELGHNLGMHHDGESNSCSSSAHIMSPTLGPGKISWSTCSKKYLDEFVRKSASSCMNDAGTIGANLNHETAGGLPGERFSVDDQCHKAFGNSYKPYTASRKPYDNVCRELWCYSSGYVKRAHPGLDGSTCATNKICKYGECVTDDRPMSQRGKSKASGK